MSQYDDKLVLLSSFCYLCLLLIVGKWLRVTFRCFQILYMPSSILGGLLGMIIGQTLKFTGWKAGNNYYESYLTPGWDQLPGFLINIVFTSVFIGVSMPRVGQVWRQAGPQLMYGQILSWGMYGVATATTGIMSLILILANSKPLNPLFATILPIGFEGGHGTVAGLTSTYESLKFPDGKDFGLLSSTLGMIVGLLIALALVNVAARFGWMEKVETADGFDEMTARGIYNWEDRPVAGHQTVMSDSIDTLTLHVCAIGAGMFLAYGTKRILLEIEGNVPILKEYAVFDSFPIFALCMVGGIVVQKCLETFTRGLYIDSEMMQRVSGVSLDFLVVAAIAKVSLDKFTGDWQQMLAFVILMVAGFGWHLFCLLVIAPRVLPDFPFQRAIAQLGHSTGTTATGLLLLKMVDPLAETTAHGAFAFMLLLHEPPMSGGLYTSLPLIILKSAQQWGNLIITVLCLVLITFWLLLYRCHFLRRYPQKPTGSLVCRPTKVDDMSSPDAGVGDRTLSEPLIVVGGGASKRRISETPSI